MLFIFYLQLEVAEPTKLNDTSNINDTNTGKKKLIGKFPHAILIVSFIETY